MTFLARLKESIGNALGAGIARAAANQPLLQRKLKEVTFGASGGEMIDRDEDEFRRVSSGRRRISRDIDKSKRERLAKAAYNIYLASPIGFRSSELTKDFAVGDGIQFKAVNPKVQEILDEFWNDPVNDMETFQDQMALEIGVFGEQCYPAMVNENDGRVRIGYIDPAEIDDVVLDPGNVRISTTVVLEPPPGVPKDKAKKLSIIRADLDPQSPTHNKLMGDCFFFATNKMTNAAHGNPDFTATADWLDTHDDFLFNVHEGALLKTEVVWDVEVQGATEAQLLELQKKYGTRRGGMFRFHNQNVKTTAVTANLQTSDMESHEKMIKTHIAAGLGLPLPWLSDGGDSTKATAGAQGLPTMRRLRSRQKFIKLMVKKIFKFVIDQAKIAKRLPEDADETVSIMMPQIWVADTQTITNSLLVAGQSIVLAQDVGWISPEQAMKLWVFIANQLGVNVETLGSPEDMIRAAEERGDPETMALLAKQKADLGNAMQNRNPGTGERETPEGAERRRNEEAVKPVDIDEAIRKAVEATREDQPPAPVPVPAPAPLIVQPEVNINQHPTRKATSERLSSALRKARRGDANGS